MLLAFFSLFLSIYFLLKLSLLNLVYCFLSAFFNKLKKMPLGNDLIPSIGQASPPPFTAGPSLPSGAIGIAIVTVQVVHGFMCWFTGETPPE
jgi:hypothetical protein